LRVLVVSDRFDAAVTGPVAAAAVAAAVAAGWRRQRPDDEVSTVPLSTGGAGLCEVLARDGDRWLDVEVVGPYGLPVAAQALLRADGVGVVEAAAACGAGLDPSGRDDPGSATTFGVGQLLRAVIDAGADRVLVGLGDCATLDAGLGALTGLGYRLRVADGSGLKIGGGEIHRLDRIEPGWAPAVTDVGIELLTDTRATLTQAADRHSRDRAEIAGALPRWRAGLEHVGAILERDLPGAAGVAAGGTTAAAVAAGGAGGGLGAALHAAFGAEVVPGAARVAGLLGLADAVASAEVVVVAQEALDDVDDGLSALGAVRRAVRSGGGPRATGGRRVSGGRRLVAVVHHLDGPAGQEPGSGGGDVADVVDVVDVVDVEQATGTAWDRDPAAALTEAASRLAAGR